MGYMDELRARAAAFSKDVERSLTGASKKSGGHTLGGGAASTGSGLTTFSRVFAAPGPLGMVVAKAPGGAASVTAVTAGSAAAQHGVIVGDVITQLEGTAVEYDGFIAKVAAAPRPVTMTFTRLPACAAGSKAPVTAEIRDARREAMLLAAEKRDREKFGKPKPRVLNQTPLQTGADAARAAAAKSDNPETVAAWKRAQSRDESTRREMGYDPFKSVSSGSHTLTAQANNLPPAPPAPPGPAPAVEDAEYSAAYEAALGSAALVVDALHTSATADRAAASGAVGVLLKLFHRVRCGNAAIQAKLLSVPGGLEALCAAGFELVEEAETDETVLVLTSMFDVARLRCVADALQASGLAPA